MSRQDERDLRVRALLDPLVDRWDPQGDPAAAAARGGRRRGLRGAAAVLTVVVFVGVVAWAATFVRRGTDVATHGSLAREGWTMQTPSDWRAQTIDACRGVDGTITDGIIVTDVDFAFRDPEGGPPSCEDRFVFDGFPDDGVALSVEPVGVRPGLGFEQPVDTPFPVQPRTMTTTDSIRGGPSMSYVPIYIDGALRGFVRRWEGPRADPAAVIELDRALGSIDVRGAAHWVSGEVPASGPGTVRYRYPDDWTVTGDEWPVRFDSPGVVGAEACTWGDNPGDLGSGAVLFVTDEVGVGPTPAPVPADLIPRPEHVDWANAETVEDDARCGGEPMTRGVWRFALAGRDVSAFLALGGPAPDATTPAIAWSIVESVEFSDPIDGAGRWTESEGADITLHDEGDGFSVTYPADWSASDVPVNTWVSSPREILALATYPLRPGGEAVTDGQVPSNAMDDLGPSDAFIWVNDGGSADARVPERPIPARPATVCDTGRELCPDPEGRSLGIDGVRAWWLYFEDHGRLLYVFVAMGEDRFQDPVRAQEVWDVLDTLLVEPR